MVSGIPTASGYEERIRFSELEVVDSGAIEHGVMNTLPEGHYVNGWDVNVAGVRVKSVKRHVRSHKHAVRIIWRMTKHMWLINDTGIHTESKEKRRNGILYWTTIWRLY